MKITAAFGANEITKSDVTADATVADVIALTKAFLGLPEKVNALIDGDVVSLDTILEDGDVVTFEKVAASKA